MIIGQSIYFARMFGISLSYIVVEMEAITVLPLGPMDTDPDFRHLGDPYAVVSGS